MRQVAAFSHLCCASLLAFLRLVLIHLLIKKLTCGVERGFIAADFAANIHVDDQPATLIDTLLSADVSPTIAPCVFVCLCVACVFHVFTALDSDVLNDCFVLSLFGFTIRENILHESCSLLVVVRFCFSLLNLFLCFFFPCHPSHPHFLARSHAAVTPVVSKKRPRI